MFGLSYQELLQSTDSSSATQAAFILGGYKLAFSQAVTTLYGLDNSFEPMAALWLSNVGFFFPIMM